MECIFCQIADKKIPSKILAETESSLAFMDSFPLTKGHSLVIPKKHYQKLQEIPKEETADLFETVRMMIGRVDKITNATLLAIHNGKDSGQEIPHLHVHLIPRSSDDGAGPVHSMFKPIQKPTEDELNEIQTQLKES